MRKDSKPRTYDGAATAERKHPTLRILDAPNEAECHRLFRAYQLAHRLTWLREHGREMTEAEFNTAVTEQSPFFAAFYEAAYAELLPDDEAVFSRVAARMIPGRSRSRIRRLVVRAGAPLSGLRAFAASTAELYRYCFPSNPPQTERP